MSDDTQGISLTALRALASIRETGSLTKTAQQLTLTQSAISRAISSLEQQLGTALLNRGTRPVQLTAEGEAAARYAASISRELHEMRQSVDDLRKHRLGTVRVASFGASASCNFLPELLQDFRLRYPGIDVHVPDNDDQLTLQTLNEGRAHFAVLSHPGGNYERISLGRDQLVALIPEQHQLSGRCRLQAEDFHQQAFIMSQAGSEPLIMRWFEKASATPDIHHRIHQINAIIAMVRSELALSIVAEWVLPKDLSGVIALPLQPSAPRHIDLLRLPQQKLSAAAEQFWRFCLARQR